MCARVCAVLVVLFTIGTAPAQEPTCTECHTSSDALRRALGDQTKPVQRLLIDKARFERSVHKARACDECHQDFGPFPHAKGRTTAGCADCHEEAAKALAKSVHGRTTTGTDSKPAKPVECRACHGVHDIFKPSDRESTLHPLNVHVTCTQCHANGAKDAPIESPARFEKYASDVHAHGIIVAGLTVSATCVACHGGHDIHAKSDPASPLARQRVDEKCGKCHVVPFEEYRRSIHFLKSNGVEHKGATCTDCHQPHGISTAGKSFISDSVASCTRCHDERGVSFRLTYHGKVTSLGYDGRVATCNTCHDNHAILPASDPRSSINPARVVSTCGQCHTDSNQGFAGYLVHADPRRSDRDHGLNLVWLCMMGLIITVMTFGGFHVFLWLFRSLFDKEWRLQHEMHDAHGRFIRRTQKIHIGVNAVATSAILMLAGTGLPLYFSQEGWARGMMAFIGGTHSAALIHRFAAVLLIATFAFFIAHVLWRAIFRHERGLFGGPWSMVPRMKDFRDLAGNFRWFFGRGPKPEFGRWIYWEKFDFWAVFWGMGIMGFTGAMLWFPEWFSRSLPAWLLNAAGVIHGLEALLAVAFHFAVQAFQINLRPDKFPLDVGFYTGVVPEKELQLERQEEYALLVKEGRLDSLVTPAPSKGVRMAATLFGGITMLLGLALLAMTAYAFM